MEQKMIQEIVDSIPMLVQFVAPGALFIWTFSFAANKKSSFENILIPSICISYIINQILYHTSFSSNLWSFVFAVISGYLLALCVNSDKVNKLLLGLGIHRTAKTSFWDNIIENDLCMIIRDEKNCYYGKVVLVDDTGETKYVVLDDVDITDENNEPVPRELDGVYSRIVFDLSEYKNFELITEKKL